MDMGLVETLVLAAHVLAALAIIGLVLIQQGRGADMGSGFGAGASSTVFGSGGAGNFLTKMTSTIAFAFFLSSFGLAFFAKEKSEEARNLGIPQVIQVPDSPTSLDRSGGDSEIPDLGNNGGQ
ncbi:MAG: preprotein translocase subunit SecG [Proteobacteria bacterium]|jgi:preprotein translocase subunit SecG|nr:preprotein translocase subunit SecG [Pseudomonadota bacterium]MDA1300320.1 preprotein translocase subunit SecG [Pseudomonadota bacterium]